MAEEIFWLVLHIVFTCTLTIGYVTWEWINDRRSRKEVAIIELVDEITLHVNLLKGGRATLDDMVDGIEGISWLYQQLGERFSENGGVENLFGLNRETLEAVSIGELDILLTEIQRAREALNHLQKDLVEIRFFKEVCISTIPLNS